jgi:hypothetical protein
MQILKFALGFILADVCSIILQALVFAVLFCVGTTALSVSCSILKDSWMQATSCCVQEDQWELGNLTSG